MSKKTVSETLVEKSEEMKVVDLEFYDPDEVPVTPLAVPTEETVVTSEESKVFQLVGDVFIFDGVDRHIRKINYENSEVVFTNPVPVYNDSYKLIGSVNLELQGDTLVGEFFIDYSTPERLNLETKEIPLFPHIDSHTDVVAVHGGVFDAVKTVINSIQLTMSPTDDARIGSL